MRFAFDDFVLDTDAFELARDGVVRPLQKRPLDLLIHLVVHRGRVVTKEELFAVVWSGAHVTDNALVQAVAAIRAALGPLGSEAVRSVRGRGYRFTRPAVLLGEGSPTSVSLAARSEADAAALVRAVLAALGPSARLDA